MFFNQFNRQLRPLATALTLTGLAIMPALSNGITLNVDEIRVKKRLSQ